MKKLLITVISILLVFAFSTMAFGECYDSSYDCEFVINEYEAIKQLAQNEEHVLQEKGYTKSEVEKIFNYKEVFKNHICMLQTLSKDMLKMHGYSDEQIAVIKNCDFSDKEMSLVSANVTINATTGAFSYPNSTGRTSGRLTYYWQWSGVPAIKLTDMVAASWNSWKKTGESSYVTYYGVTTGTVSSSGTATFTEPSNSAWNGGGHKFAMTKFNNNYYAKSGGGRFDVESDGLYQKDFYYEIEYGHATITPNISFSVSIPGGLSPSISFSSGVTKMCEDSGGYYW